MAVYMIDYENVKTGGLNGISRLTGSDRVIIFYSENANRLTFDLHQRLMASTAQIEYREVSVGGHNALDFQLVTYLGYLIAQEPNGQYLIISNDRGFEYVVNFWRRDGLSIGLLPYLKDPAYALQKAARPDVRPLAQPEFSVSEDEPADEPAVEPVAEPIPDEVPVAADEPISDPIPDEVPEPVAAESTAVEAPVAETVVAESVVAESVAEPVIESPVAAEAPKPAQSRRSRGGRQRRADKPAEAPAEPAKTEKPAEPRKPRVTVQPAKAAKTANASKAAPAEAPEAPVDEPVKPAVALSPQLRTELRAMLGDSVADDPELRYVIGCVEKYKTKLGLNNALVKRFGNQKASELYQKLKPLLSEKKTISAPRKKEKAGVS